MVDQFYSNKNILVTGAAGELGSNLVRRLAAAGANLVLSGRSRKKLELLKESLPDQIRIEIITADLSVPGEAATLAGKAIDLMGRIDILINNAGIGYFALLEESREDRIRQVFEINTFAPLNIIKALLPGMKQRNSGKIVNIVSAAGRVPIPTVSVYGGSKSALAIMCNTMRVELMDSGVEIVNIYPGTIDTSFERNALRESERHGLCPTDHCGMPTTIIAEQIIEAAAGPPGEIWLEKEGKWLAAASIFWPKYIEKKLEPLRNRVKAETEKIKPHQYRKWNLWQLESSLACNLKCIMCPWPDFRNQTGNNGIMSQEIWDALIPHLNEVRTIDFTGGGEPLYQKNLIGWMTQAKSAGCNVGFLSNGLLLTRAISDRIVAIGADWLAFSLDGATKETYESIRRGSDFDRVCDNINYLASIRMGPKPLLMLNFVIMNVNSHEIEEVVNLAARLGVDQVNFKQCDVIREEHGKGFGIFDSKETKEIKRVKKSVARAQRIARKQNINITCFSFTPDELPVCDQDPRSSLFIRYDGSVAPCINLACGGKTHFLGRDVEMPTVHYGKIPDSDLLTLWDTATCKSYRERFEKRVAIHDSAIANTDYGRSLTKLQDALKNAVKAMPTPPKGCEVCHYLHDI